MILDDEQLKSKVAGLQSEIVRKQNRMNQLFAEKDKIDQDLEKLKEEIIKMDGMAMAYITLLNTEVRGEADFDKAREKARKDGDKTNGAPLRTPAIQS